MYQMKKKTSPKAQWMTYNEYIFRKTMMEMMEENYVFEMTGWLGRPHKMPITEEDVRKRIEENEKNNVLKNPHTGETGE